MKREYLQIRLPEKCNEDWNQMQPVERGRHCAACHKCVVDFSGMTDNELFQYFKMHKEESVCGQFAPHQLDRKIARTVERKDPFSVLRLAASLFLGGLAFLPKSAKAQEHTVVQVEDGVAAKGSRQVHISGKITDANGQVLAEVKVTFGCGDSVLTDTLGNYSYEYTGAKPLLSLKVSNSEELQLHEEQIALSHLAVGECSMLTKDVTVGEPERISPEPVEPYIRAYGGIAPHRFITVGPTVPLVDTLGNLLDSFRIKKTCSKELKAKEVSSVDQGTYSRLRKRVASSFKTEEPEFELRKYESSNGGNNPRE